MSSVRPGQSNFTTPVGTTNGSIFGGVVPAATELLAVSVVVTITAALLLMHELLSSRR
jgi:hypothetical protein